MDADILVVGVGQPSRDMLVRLTADLHATLGRPATVAGWKLDPSIAHDPLRNQYNSSQLLASLVEHEDAYTRILGVTPVDLFAPVLTYVFGEAQLNGPTAIVSTHRLRPELYGLPKDGVVLRRRLLVEAVHELGHTAGLRHCPDPSCAMHGSSYVEEIDLKGPGLCERCTEVFDRSFTPPS